MNKNLLTTGQIVNTHGLRGHVKVISFIKIFIEQPEGIAGVMPTIFIDGKEYEVEHSVQQKSMVLLKLKGVDSIDDAAKLRNKEIAICRDDVELEEGVVFIADLIGLPVLADGVEIGKITEVLDYPGNKVYVVKGEHEYMIPAVKAFILDTDMEKNEMQVKLIEGMRSDED